MVDYPILALEGGIVYTETNKSGYMAAVRHVGMHPLHLLIPLLLALCLLWSRAAGAQDAAPPTLPAAEAPVLPPAPVAAKEKDVLFEYDQPSDELDFDLPPLPGLEQTKTPAPAPATADALPAPDRFFSDAPVLEEEEPEAAPAATPKPAEMTPQKKPKFVRRAPPAPPYNFKTVKLPSTIYRKAYNEENRHLPVAYYTEDVARNIVATSQRGQTGALRALRRVGVSVNQEAENGDSVVATSTRAGRLETVHWLLIHGAAVDRPDAAGLAPLHYAAYRGDPRMVELLVAYGADVNSNDARGVTPLMYAARRGGADAVEKLIELGANPELRNSWGESAADLAARSGDKATLSVLERAGWTEEDWSWSQGAGTPEAKMEAPSEAAPSPLAMR
jgi:hypothetical protein